MMVTTMHNFTHRSCSVSSNAISDPRQSHVHVFVPFFERKYCRCAGEWWRDLKRISYWSHGCQECDEHRRCSGVEMRLMSSSGALLFQAAWWRLVHHQEMDTSTWVSFEIAVGRPHSLGLLAKFGHKRPVFLECAFGTNNSKEREIVPRRQRSLQDHRLLFAHLF